MPFSIRKAFFYIQHKLIFQQIRTQSLVRSNDCWSSHSLIFASCPESRISGTFHPYILPDEYKQVPPTNYPGKNQKGRTVHQKSHPE